MPTKRSGRVDAGSRVEGRMMAIQTAEARRVMIVTGASSGIGEALARAAAPKFRLLLVARRADRLTNVSRAVHAAGGAVETLALDVTKSSAAHITVETALRSFGRIDVVVNNAGRGDFGQLLEQSDDAIEAQLRLNLIAPLQFSRAALPLLEASGGQLVFLGSSIARVPLPNYGAYAPAKAALRAATITLRRELRDRGIAVTYVDPGVVASEWHAASGMQRNRLVPVASPQRVARAILRGVERRAAVVNAQPLQALGSVFGEWTGALGDALLVSRLSAKRSLQ
jgi:short-subunit dehydrogenase